MTTLIPILCDQLSMTVSSLTAADPGDSVVLLVETPGTMADPERQPAAMRRHASALRDAGWTVAYVPVQNAGGDAATCSVTDEVGSAIERHQADRVLVTQPSTLQLLERMQQWQTRFGVPVAILRP